MIELEQIFIHSLKLDEHLKVLTNKAREHRRQNKNIAFELTDYNPNYEFGGGGGGGGSYTIQDLKEIPRDNLRLIK